MYVYIYFFSIFFCSGLEVGLKVPQQVQNMVLEVCERIDFGPDLTYDVLCWTGKLLKELRPSTCYTKSYPITMALLLTARDHERWISEQKLFNYFEIPPSKMFKYIKLVNSKVKNTNIDNRQFKNMIGYVRQCRIMSCLHTKVIKKMYERFSRETDLSPIHIITCIIVNYHTTSNKIDDEKKMKLVEICDVTGTRPKHVKKLLSQYKMYTQQIDQ